MRIATNKNTLTNAIIKPMGTGFFVTIGRKNKFFDREETATNYITSLGYQF